LFPPIFQLNVSAIKQFPYITDWLILNEHFPLSFVQHASHSIRSHLSSNWLFNFRLRILSFDRINNCKISSPLFNWQYLLSWSAFRPNDIFKHSDSPLIQSTFYSTILHPSLAICDDLSSGKIINQWFQRTVTIRSAFLSISFSFCL
jgi:hypothetical protein